MPYLLLLAYLATRTSTTLTSKQTSRDFTPHGISGSLVYTIEVGLFSLFFYWALNSFKLTINGTVLIYGAIWGALAVTNMVLNIFMYNYGTVTFVNFVSNTISVTSAALFGLILFNESITVDKIIRILLMILCVMTMFYGTKKKSPREITSEKKKNAISPLAFVIPAVVSLLGVFATMLQKYYVGDASSTDNNSLFFTCNIFCIIYSAPILFLACKKEGVGLRQLTEITLHKRSTFVFLHTAICAVQQVIMTLLISRMDLAVYTPLTSALAFVAFALATPLVKEKLDKYTIAATAIAILSIVLPEIIF